MNHTPLGDRVIIKPEEVNNKRKSGLYVPETAKVKPNKGEVVAVKKDEDDLKVGDEVLYEKGRGTEIVEDGVEYIIIETKHLLTFR